MRKVHVLIKEYETFSDGNNKFIKTLLDSKWDVNNYADFKDQVNHFVLSNGIDPQLVDVTFENFGKDDVKTEVAFNYEMQKYSLPTIRVKIFQKFGKLQSAFSDEMVLQNLSTLHRRLKTLEQRLL
jgi:hypothetical protein